MLLISEIVALIFILKLRPYKLSLDNLSLITNLSLEILFQIFMFLREKEVLPATD